MMMDDRRLGGRHDDEPTVDMEDASRDTNDEDSNDGEFEFPSVSREADGEGLGGAAPADELFAGGRIRAFYPVFGRRVHLDDGSAAPEERKPPPRAPLGRLFQLEKARTSSVASTSSSSSSSASTTASGDLDAASPDSYCLWTPGASSAASSPSRPPRKSGSTGSMARWRRIGELVVGRSQSDGRDKFLFLSAPPSPARESSPDNKAKKQQPAKGSKKTEVDTVAAGRRMSYAGGANKKGSPPGARRTFLPYRQDLVGLFANARGHGLSRNHHHPF